MNIVTFPEANALFKAPPGFEDEVQTLPALQAELHFQDGTTSREVISCWELSPEELEEVKKTGRIWLSVWGVELPPCGVHAFPPFRVIKPQADPSQS